MFGFLNVSKPVGITSHDVVAKVRKLVGLKQVGHAGTLDPKAQGVLPIALGCACRLMRFLATDKVYLGEILLGTRTTTDDLEGAIVAQVAVDANVANLLEAAVADLVGTYDQTPPAYSAVHHDGKRLYELARTGRVPETIRSRQVTVDAIDILDVNLPVVRVRIKCSGGTYIRAIARDLGEKLGCGACLKTLIREQSGPFLIADAHSLESLAELAAGDRFTEAVIPPQKVLALELVSVNKDAARLLSMGQYLPIASLSSADKSEFNDGKLCLAMFEQSLVAVCSVTQDNELHPEVVVANARTLA
jgi:tRNA pseudouridine55 synthase